jgi:ribosomal protein S9
MVDSVQTFGRKKTAVAVAYVKRGRGLIKVKTLKTRDAPRSHTREGRTVESEEGGTDRETGGNGGG